MASRSLADPGQLMLFDVRQEKRADGTFLITPVAVRDEREISVQRAMAILKFKDRETIYGLLASGRIRGWKPESERGNGKWRIYEQSVMDYKARRDAAARNGEA